MADAPDARPRRRMAVVACMDARLDPAAIMGFEAGDAHVIRNAGGVVTDDVIRSLTLSQRLLATEEVVLLQHTDCGLTKFTDEELHAEIEAEVGVRPHFALEAFADVESSLRQGMERIEASPFLPRRGCVRAYVYDVADGTKREVTR